MTHHTSGAYKNGIEKKVLLLHISRRIWEMDALFGVWSRDGGGGLGPKSNFHRINALYLYLHLADFDGKHWQIYHTWILWVNISGLITCHTVDGRNPTPPDMYETLASFGRFTISTG